ncbi:MAG: AAA family ATPase, partial [Chloroflexota bacterium]|nr:AAA family ATPase [Chloroflexota bacterium]
MHKSFTIRSFRCFDDLAIEPLERINLIAGKNNIGKTALLEALWLHHGYHNPELGLMLRVLRGLDRF